LSYEYDLAGRRSKTGGDFARTNLPTAVTSASYNAANQQTAFGGQTLTYDLNGNLTGDGVNAYTWNARGQLTSISGPGWNATFQYDAARRRVGKTVNSVTTAFLYDGVNAVQEQSGGSPSANVLSAGLDQFFIRSEASGTSSPLVDGLGSSIAMADSTGTVQTEYTYEPFGRASTSGATSNNQFQYTGRENDGTDLYYYRARYYAPSLQRFISEDPIGLTGSLNLFAYVGNNPTGLVDPLGLNEKSNTYWLGAAGTVSSGFGDSLSFAPALYLVPGSGGSWTGLARKITGATGTVDTGSWWYTLGQGCAVLWSAAAGAAVAARAGATSAVEGGISRIYSARVLLRSAAEPGPYHNFPMTFDEIIFNGQRSVVSNNYVLYTCEGGVNSADGVFEIGVRPSASGRVETVVHRFFRPN